MKRIYSIAITLLLLCTAQVNAQDDWRHVNLDQSTHDSIIVGPGTGLTLYDDGGNGNYSGGYDREIHVQSDCRTDTNVLFAFNIFEGFDENIASTDTLYIYDGPNRNSPLVFKMSYHFRTSPSNVIYMGQNNTSGIMTIRFYSKLTPNVPKPAGWKIDVQCLKPCELIHPVIDSVYEHIDLVTGEVVTRRMMGKFPNMFDSIFLMDTVRVYDTVWADSTHTEYTLTNPHDSIIRGDLVRVDTIGFVPGMTSCIGLGIQLHGHGEYTHNTGVYTPTDRTSTFYWSFEGDTILGHGLTTVAYGRLQSTGCTDVYLSIVDEEGCTSNESIKVQIRVAQNPIKTIFDLSAICNNSYRSVSVGTDDPNSTLSLKTIDFDETHVKTYAIRQFIPDGPNCETVLGSKCYYAPVEFNEFPSGKTVQSASDICSICINYEHSFMGDYRVAVLCPSYDPNTNAGMAVLKYGKAGTGGTCDPLAPVGGQGPDGQVILPSPDGSGAGGGQMTGWNSDGPFQNMDSYGVDACDSLKNPFGLGLDYCWSRNAKYTLVTGDPANRPTRFEPGNWYISSSGNTVTYQNPVMPVVPAGFKLAGTTPSASSVTTRKPSDMENKLDYYSPASDFSELVGCPLNGIWQVQVCDFWGSDNGWVFSWTLDICGVATGDQSCNYQVGVDSVTWRPDTNYATDFRDGVYKGLVIEEVDSVESRIYSPDTSGDFRIKLKIYDKFGCIWDTATRIATIHTPQPSLGEDVTLCSTDSLLLEGSDGYNGVYNNISYIWSPYGEETHAIYSHSNHYDTKDYIVQATNLYRKKGSQNKTKCVGRDTIRITINEQPILSFDPGVYPLEGCEPFVLDIKNTTKFGYKYRWEFGDGVITTQKEPRHAYGAGQYSLRYYVESEKGCKDSLIFDSLVTVFPNPTANFTWEPEYISAVNPEVRLINKTEPHTLTSKYFWEVQYSKDYPNSYATLRDKDPVYRWKGDDVAGDYKVRLIARTDNYGPSGNLVKCADTVESTLLLINDYLQFPTVVTPNNDGNNDRFVIHGLLEGLGYQINTLDIYDKWGSRVFHATNINKDEDFWDPARTNSPTGTYFYRFVGKGQTGTIERNGVVEVLK